MNQKKAKQLRKAVKSLLAVADVPAVVTTHERLMLNGMPIAHRVVNPIRYPSTSRRRIYQDIKRGRASPSHQIASAMDEAAYRIAA